jgi:uncharacterized protein YceK
MKALQPKYIALVSLLGLGLGGCTTVVTDDIAARPDYSAQSHAAFAQCQGEAMSWSRLAAKESTAALYYSSARAMDHCLADVADDEVLDSPVAMQAQALMTMEFIKAGDLDAARTALDEFEDRYPNLDLYFADGASFVESAGLLLGGYVQRDVAAGSLLNVGKKLKSELRRVDYWQQH